ncbi:MAG: protein-disulfide reductase [Sphingobacteriales bacterium SCN 48-20]|uniref:protein-disulfide reductase DsbD family protein n=1 Tax=Terrimonas ferruginea TaxID=249 RepID=UPI00086A8024|nr:cytochrome c biogenesis protein CcdA [Terrimonas ferruginea]MBN8782313.1 thioredoxin family protein [Terrimonas ferruginea]ODT91206.1 MAG: protein-disulfide reductase [Sphingobacteriales bacterium SCN 48-20]OJW42835.1 MAG: protein-disulfide reductase [Sphingobacteriales bacterium 48-107]
MNKFFAIILLFTLPLWGAAQDSLPVKITPSFERTGPEEVTVVLKLDIKPGVKVFGLAKDSAAQLFSSFVFDSTAEKLRSGKPLQSSNLKKETNPELGEVEFFQDSAVWKQQLKISSGDSAFLKGTATLLYQNGESFEPVEVPFRINITSDVAVTSGVANTNEQPARSLIWIFLSAFGGGLLALLTPCVYSMIPVTVSFFTKRSKSRAEGIRNAFYYSVSIVVIFTLIGFLVTLIFGPAALNNLATNWIANIVFFAIFLIFGISFLGAFEITLPASWSTRADSRASTGSFWGIFFMALTLVIVSFSCTGPIIGNLLVLASKGSYYGPLVGMFGFSLALALPFALFAFFPSKLNLLGKAGGWLNSVKVTLGFLELALALKFLSNADLARNWRILDREVFLSLWIVIFLLLGLYLLGKLRFHHDDDLPKNDFGHPYLTVTRLFFAIGAFTFMVYMVPGLWGAPLKGLSAFLPPMGTQDFNSAKSQAMAAGGSSSNNGALPHPQKYYEVMKKNEPDVVVNNGLVTYFEYEEALEVAKKTGKPLMLDFTGINCINCRKMEGQVWSDPRVMQKLKDEFIIASLFVDVHHGVDLPPAQQYYSEALKKQVETLGDRNTDIAVTRFGANTQPYYFFLDGSEKRLIQEGYGYDPDVDKFLRHLDAAIAEFKKRK